MRGKDYNTGLRGVLFESRHYERMGAAVWLYGWLVLRQTHQQGSLGWVLGGSPVSYREIEEETGFNSRTLERWMQILRRAGYVETEAAPGGVIIRITKAKKFPQGPRKSADGIRKAAEACPQNRVAPCSYLAPNVEVADRIGSSSVGRSQERRDTRLIHKDFHRTASACENSLLAEARNPSCLGQTQKPQSNLDPATQQQPGQQGNLPSDARLLRQLLRAERDEAVRRELAVGTGPEVRRS
jgi:hypothetical protein